MWDVYNISYIKLKKPYLGKIWKKNASCRAFIMLLFYQSSTITFLFLISRLMEGLFLLFSASDDVILWVAFCAEVLNHAAVVAENKRRATAFVPHVIVRACLLATMSCLFFSLLIVRMAHQMGESSKEATTTILFVSIRSGGYFTFPCQCMLFYKRMRRMHIDYVAQNQLEAEQLSPTGSQRMIDLSIVKQYRHDETKSANEVCSICIEPLLKDPNTSYPVVLGCNHSFHAECINKHVGTSPNATCPLCRRQIVETVNLRDG